MAGVKPAKSHKESERGDLLQKNDPPKMVSIQKLWYTNLKSPKQNMAVLGFLGIKMLWIFFGPNKNLVKAGYFFWGMGE